MTLTSSGYDPDGIQSLLNEDEIDWDAFDWEGWSWVVHPDLENTPMWKDLDWDDRRDWFQDNKDRFEDLITTGVAGATALSEGGPIGTAYNADVMSGAEGGTEINYDYYQNDPWYTLAFDNLDMEIDPEVGLTQEHLQEATKYLVETFRSVMNDGYRQSWDAELPESWQPKEMTTDYQTPFEIPGIVKRMASPVMSGPLQNLRTRSGSYAEQMHRNMAANTPAQPGFKGEGRPEGLAILAPRGSEEMIANVQKILDDDAYPDATNRDPRAWQDYAGVKSIGSRSDINIIKDTFRAHSGVLPVDDRGLPKKAS